MGVGGGSGEEAHDGDERKHPRRESGRAGARRDVDKPAQETQDMLDTRGETRVESQEGSNREEGERERESRGETGEERGGGEMLM